MAAARGSDLRLLAPGPRRVITIGAALLAVGLATVAIGPSDEGMAVTLLALLALIYGVHAFGRLGPDEEPSGDVGAKALARRPGPR